MQMKTCTLFELDRDPLESRFSASVLYGVEHAVATLRTEGIPVRRVRFLEDPLVFLDQPEIAQLLEEEGDEAFPVLMGQDQILCKGAYPTAEQWAQWTGLPREKFPDQFSEQEVQLWFSFLHENAGGCGGSCSGCSGCSGGCAEDPLSDRWGDLETD